MKIYKAKIEKLSFDWGRFEGWHEIGYYADKTKAEKAGKDFADNHEKIDFGEVKIEEIEVIE